MVHSIDSMPKSQRKQLNVETLKTLNEIELSCVGYSAPATIMRNTVCGEQFIYTHNFSLTSIRTQYEHRVNNNNKSSRRFSFDLPLHTFNLSIPIFFFSNFSTLTNINGICWICQCYFLLLHLPYQSKDPIIQLNVDARIDAVVELIE